MVKRPRPRLRLASVPVGLVVGAVAVVASLALPNLALAEGPASLSPANGAGFLVGAPVDFTVEDLTVGKTLWIHASRSPATDSAGVIGYDAFIDQMTGGPPTWTARWTNSALDGPGTYYWQPFRIDSAVDPDGYVEGAVRTLIVAGPTARISAGGACYREGTGFRVTGAGFRPGAEVDIEVDSRKAGSAVADGQGRISARARAPKLGTSLPTSRRLDVAAYERVNTSNRATAKVRVAALAFDASPSLFVRPGQRIRFTFSGFASRRSLYAHYRFGGRTRATKRLGRTRAPCGTLSARAPLIPSGIARNGRWTVQFDARRGYSGRTSPRLRARIRVSTIG
jgi:hypothetical protein